MTPRVRTFTFLGGSGWAYGKGAPAFYIICYGSLAYITSYWLMPAIVGVVAMLWYLVLQLKGLRLIVSEASNGAVSSGAAMRVGTVGLVVQQHDGLVDHAHRRDLRATRALATAHGH